jgi:hypothetical protein
VIVVFPSRPGFIGIIAACLSIMLTPMLTAFDFRGEYFFSNKKRWNQCRTDVIRVEKKGKQPAAHTTSRKKPKSDKR